MGTVALCVALSCGRQSNSPNADSSRSKTLAASSAAAGSGAVVQGLQVPVEPTTLLTLGIPAYHASVALDDDTVYVLTSKAAFRIRPGRPPQEVPLELSYGATLTRDSFLYWSQGAVWKAPKEGGTAYRVGALSEQPKFFVASRDTFGWLAGRGDDYFLQNFRGGKPKTTYASPAAIDTAILVQDWFFFVERAADTTWRIGRARIAGSAPTFGEVKTGSSPAVLATADEKIYYYYSEKREVRRLSPDFQQDETLERNCICSPLAASKAVYCGRVEGLFEISGRATRRLTDNGGRMVTGMAANTRWVVWLTDSGPEQLTVKMLPVE